MATDELAALELTGVGKRYWKLQEQAMLLRSLLPFARPTRSELLALHNVNLSVASGETVGVLGRNGAGKTTLLRLLAGVSRPSSGEVVVRGRVAPLISVGVGFHQEMSGRENVYVNGMLLGLTKRQVDERFDAIVEFSELADFIDTPVKFYSSGMFLRLGFSVAIHVDPDILLLDEILAVGDLAFQLKCFERMRTLKDRGTTIILVSHSMHAIRLLCPRAIVMRKGELIFDGDVESAIGAHHDALALDSSRGDPDGTLGGVSLIDRELIGPDGPTSVTAAGVPMKLTAKVQFDAQVDSPMLNFFVIGEDGTLVYEMRSVVDRKHRSFAAGTTLDAEVTFTHRLGGGTYRLMMNVMSSDGRDVLFRDRDGLVLYVPPPIGTAGFAHLEATITLDGDVMTDHPSVML